MEVTGNVECAGDRAHRAGLPIQERRRDASAKGRAGTGRVKLGDCDEVIEDHPGPVWKLLIALDWSPLRPTGQPRERNEAETLRWRRKRLRK